MESGAALGWVLCAVTVLTAARANFVGPYKYTFASADPVGAQAFAEKYLGAVYVKQPHKGGDGECAMVKWVIFPNTSTGGWSGEYQMHFVKGYHRPNGTMTIDEFEDTMAALHGNLTAGSYDQYLDFHPTLTTPDLDPLASLLLRDNVPFLVRELPGEISLFVEMPRALIVEVVGQKLTVAMQVPSQRRPWDPCATPTRAMASPDPTHVATRERWEKEAAFARATSVVLPALQPLRTTYASAEPGEAAQFVARFFGGELDVSEPVAKGNGTCWDMHTVTFHRSSATPAGRQGAAAATTKYELRWVRRPAKPGAPSLSLQTYEQYLRRLHGNIGQNGTGDVYDEYMDFHVGLNFQDGDPILRRLWAEREPFFTRGQYGKFIDLFLEGPGGQIYEVMAQKQTLLTAAEIEPWNLCGPQR